MRVSVEGLLCFTVKAAGSMARIASLQGSGSARLCLAPLQPRRDSRKGVQRANCGRQSGALVRCQHRLAPVVPTPPVLNRSPRPIAPGPTPIAERGNQRQHAQLAYVP